MRLIDGIDYRDLNGLSSPWAELGWAEKKEVGQISKRGAKFSLVTSVYTNVLGMTLNSSVVVLSMTLNSCGTIEEMIL